MSPTCHRHGSPAHRLRAFTPATVYCVLLNHEGERERLSALAAEAPYRGLPTAPVLAIRPANTLAEPLRAVRMPTGVTFLEAVPCLAAVIDKAACRVSPASALDFVGAWGLAFDFSLPLSNWHRPAIRQKCHDGFCRLMPVALPLHEAESKALLSQLGQAQVFVEQLSAASEASRGDAKPDFKAPRWHRDPANLLAEVSQFMTLHQGDCMLFPLTDEPLRAAAGQALTLQIPTLGAWQVKLEAAS